MLVRLLLFTTILYFSLGSFFAQNTITPEQYISQWKNIAIQNMYNHKIPASITLAQGILESGAGNSRLAVQGNNHFGIKCHNTWEGDKIYHDDDKKQECFRKYETADESFKDHCLFLQKARYAKLFELEITDYKGWAKELKAAGYATNPKYPQLLIDLIEKYDLTQYDKGEQPYTKEPVLASTPIKKTPKQKEDTSIGETTIVLGNKHLTQYTDNNVPYIIVKENDSFKSLSEELDMRPWQFYKYNDVNKNYALTPGEKIYIKPKRGKATAEFHLVKQGETMHGIAQKHAIKLKKLYRFNNMPKGSEALVGQTLNLRKRKK